MRQKFSKEVLSISIIGKKRFWIGIVAGLITALSLSFFIDYSRESMRFFSVLSRDILILPEKEVAFFDYFFSSFSTVFALGITLWIWLSNQRHTRTKHKIYKRFAQTNILLTIWVFLMFIARWGTIIPIMLYGIRGYDNHLDLYDDAWFLFIMMPIVIFLNNWFTIRLVYKSSKWILYSFIVATLLTVILANTKPVNRNILTEAFHNHYDYKYSYIEEELNKAIKGNIKFNEDTKRILKQNFTESTINQVAEVQNAFNRKIKVSLDTLILEKIMVHNHKVKKLFFYHRDEADNNWAYAYPEQIYEQIKMYNNDCIEVKYLFEILNEMILPLNAEEPDWNKQGSVTIYQADLYQQKRFYRYNTNTIVSRLVQVVDKLKDDLHFQKYHYLLKINNSENLIKNRWQKELFLDLDRIDNIYNNKIK